MQKSLQQSAENTRPGLEELAKLLKEAAENLKNEQQQLAQESLDGAAQELDSIQQRMDSQQLKNMASQQIQSHISIVGVMHFSIPPSFLSGRRAAP